MVLTKRERLEKTIAGEMTDRAPVTLWRHWPGDDQRPSDLVTSLLYYQQQWDFDFIHIAPPPTSYILDYGGQDVWEYDWHGQRTMSSRPISRSLHWTELAILDPLRGWLGQQIELVRLMHEAIKGPIPQVMTIYSPLTQAVMLAGESLVLKHMRLSPERLKTGLNTLMNNTIRFIDALYDTRLDGINFVITHADHQFMSLAEYEVFGATYDRQILDAVPDQWWLNIVSVQGQLPMMPLLAEYRAQVLSWPDQVADDFDLAAGKLAFQGAVYGGLENDAVLHRGTPRSVRDAARQAFELTNNRRIILGASSPILLSTPQSNIRAARESVDISEMMK